MCNDCTDSNAPAVFPLQVFGTVDIELSSLNANEMLSWGMSKLWDKGMEGIYGVKHGSAPVKDLAEDEENGRLTNYFKRAFPCLYPYGEGGMERQKV